MAELVKAKPGDKHCYARVKVKKSGGKVTENKIQGSYSYVEDYIEKKRRDGTLYDFGEIYVDNSKSIGDEPWRKYIKGEVTDAEAKDLDQYEKYWSDFESKYDPQAHLDSLRNSAPKAETQIKVSGESAKILKDFVNKNLLELDNNHKITTFFIDTEEEYQKYGVQVPGICLVVADKRATKASLKKEPLVVKFDKSKTLKRYSDWKRGTVANVQGEVWYTIYISGRDAKANGIKALREEVSGMTLIGYLNEEGSVLSVPAVGRAVVSDGEAYLVESVDGQDIKVFDEEGIYDLREDRCEQEVILLEDCDEIGSYKGDLLCIGCLDESLVYSDSSDNVYLYEGFTDELEGQMVYRDRKTGKPIVTGELDPKKDTIMYWNTDGDHFIIKKSEFKKKFKAGKEEDFDLFESCREKK